jgi:hypothetical protein
MKRIVCAAIAALSLFATPASAWDADPTLTRNIIRWYQAAPQQLRDIIERPYGKVDVYITSDQDRLRREMAQYFGMTAGAVSKIIGPTTYDAMTVTKVGKLPTIWFVQPAMLAELAEGGDDNAQRVVHHEMMHVYDFISAGPAYKRSNSPAMLAAFKADTAENNRYLAQLRQQAKRGDQEAARSISNYIQHYGYYAAKAQEIYAEAGARLLVFPGKTKWNNLIDYFPRVTKQVCLDLVRDRVIYFTKTCDLGYSEAGS